MYNLTSYPTKDMDTTTKTLEQALEIYSQAKETNNLKQRAKLVAQALENLNGEGNIRQIAEEEDIYLRERFSISSLGTKLSQAGYNKLINAIPLKDGHNAQMIGKRDAQGNIKSHQLKHYFFKYCGLSKKAFYPEDETVIDEWAQRNDTTRIVDRGEINPDTEEGEKWAINPDNYLHKTQQLITSSEIFDICAGLIAASGRRPNEIFRGKFALIEGKSHTITFKSGFAKKRGEKIQPYEISTLINAEYWLKQLNKFQKSTEIKSLFSQIKNQYQDILDQNLALDRRTNKRINRIVKANFQDTEILNPRPTNKGNQDLTSATDLRSAYLCLAVERDYSGSLNRKIIAAGKLTGHLAIAQGKSLSDRDLSKLGYTIGYTSYYIKNNQPVPLINIPVKRDKKQPNRAIRIHREDLKQVNTWKDTWEMNQADTIAQVVKLAKERLEMGNVSEVTSQDFEQLKAEFEAYKQATEQKLNKILETVNNLSIQALQNQASQQGQNLPNQQDQSAQHLQNQQDQLAQNLVNQQSFSYKPKPRENTRDWESVSKEELFGWSDEFTKPARGKGAKEARIARVVQGIFEWNNQFPHDAHFEKKVVPNTQIIRGLSGANPQDIKEWLQMYNSMVLDHAHKHGLINSDGSLDVYHNRKAKPEPHVTPDLLKNFIV